MYGKLGRMTGRSYEDTVHTLIKGLKSAESQTRAETFIAFGKYVSYAERCNILYLFIGICRSRDGIFYQIYSFVFK